MTSFPNSPKLTRGAIVSVTAMNAQADIIMFQYNPETMRRTLTPQRLEAQQNRRDEQRLTGPPRESITMSVEIDATDQLETASFPATRLGLYPVLAALETLLYPRSSLVLNNEILAQVGITEVIPAASPMTLLVWGVKRVVPVRLTSFSVDEQHYDTHLNPIQAKVELGMDVLNYNDLGLASPGGALFMAHQVVKEAMAALGSVKGTLSSL